MATQARHQNNKCRSGWRWLQAAVRSNGVDALIAYPENGAPKGLVAPRVGRGSSAVLR